MRQLIFLNTLPLADPIRSNLLLINREDYKNVEK